VVTEAVPFARPGAHLTREFDDLLAWLATRMDKTSDRPCGEPSVVAHEPRRQVLNHLLSLRRQLRTG
jgi:hypothetical protein